MPLLRNVGQMAAAYSAVSNAASSPGTEPYVLSAADFLFDANVISSMYQDPFQETVVSVSSDPVSYMQDQAISAD